MQANFPSSPKITLITPSFNQVGFIEQTIRSVTDQNHTHLEYIVIDGGSTDGTAEVIQKYENRLAYWTSEPDKGMYDALQKGFGRSTGDIMGWINSDDMLHPGALAAVAEIFSSFPQIEWIQGLPSFFDEQGRIVQTGPFKKWSPFHFYMGDFKWIQQESTFWRRSLWEKAGGYIDKNLLYAGDFDLWIRFFRHASLYSCTALIGGFRLRKTGQLSQTHMKEYMKEAKGILTKELSLLPPGKKKKLVRIQSQQRIFNVLRRIRILNAAGYYSRTIQPQLELAPEIVFSRATQSFFLK